MKEQLNQLNTEVAAITAEIEAAYAAYESAAAATTRAVIALAGASDDKTLELLHDAANKEEKRALGRYEDLKKDQKCLNSMRAWLQANLRGAGERSRCLRRDSGTRQCGICRSVFTDNIYQIVTLQIHLKY